MSAASTYTEDLADQVCDHIAQGLTLRQVEAIKGMPARSTIARWMTKEPFASKCARARAAATPIFEDEMLETARGATDKDSALCARVVIGTLQWINERRNPQLYGNKSEKTINFSKPMNEMTLEELDAEIARRSAGV